MSRLQFRISLVSHDTFPPSDKSYHLHCLLSSFLFLFNSISSNSWLQLFIHDNLSNLRYSSNSCHQESIDPAVIQYRILLIEPFTFPPFRCSRRVNHAHSLPRNQYNREEWHAVHSNLQLLQERPRLINNIDVFTRSTMTPPTMFVDLGLACLAEAVATKVATTRDLRVGTPAKTMERPELGLESIAGFPSKASSIASPAACWHHREGYRNSWR
jgi:hypothetical protein